MIIVLIAGMAALLTLAMAVGLIAFERSPFAARVKPSRMGGTSGWTPQLTRNIQSLGRIAGRGDLDTARRGVLAARLARAGFYSDIGPEVFFGIRALAAAGLAFGGLLACLLLRIDGVLAIALTVMTGAAIGLFSPNIWLSRRIKARERALTIGLPDALDLMVVCAEAGGTIASAIQRVELEFRDLHPVLTEQLRIVNLEMQAGASRAEALQRFAQRAPLDEVRKLVGLIIQSEALGASIAQTMRVFANEMRDNRYLDAERRAAELPVKISIPLVLFIFPALGTVIFTPIVIRFIRILFKL